MSNKFVLVVEDEERKQCIAQEQAKREQRQAKLASIADKKAKGKLTLEDLSDKLDIIIEMLGELTK